VRHGLDAVNSQDLAAVTAVPHRWPARWRESAAEYEGNRLAAIAGEEMPLEPRMLAASDPEG
jgi:hypothetical protein